tara:strand:+ start:500 stop:1072 length:573 start_codon:yes stop_codon:yes gene_type:complete
MTNTNAKDFISLYVTRANRLNNDIFKDLEKGVESTTYKACIELTTLSNEELIDMGYKALFEYKKNSKGKKVLAKKRQFKNDTSAYKSIIENIDKIVEFSQTTEAKNSKVNGVRGVVSKTNAYFNPTVKTEKSQVGTSEKASRTKEEVLKNFADIWTKEFGTDLLDMIEFASSEEGIKICDYSIEQVAKAS